MNWVPVAIGVGSVVAIIALSVVGAVIFTMLDAIRTHGDRF